MLTFPAVALSCAPGKTTGILMSDDEKMLIEFFTAIILDDIAEVRETLSAHPEAVDWLSPAKYPPLHIAILNHRPEIAVLLAEHGADLSRKAEGESAQSMAARKGMLDVLERASARKEICRAEQIDAHIRDGLKKPIQVSRKPLALKVPKL